MHHRNTLCITLFALMARGPSSESDGMRPRASAAYCLARWPRPFGPHWGRRPQPPGQRQAAPRSLPVRPRRSVRASAPQRTAPVRSAVAGLLAMNPRPDGAPHPKISAHHLGVQQERRPTQRPQSTPTHRVGKGVEPWRNLWDAHTNPLSMSRRHLLTSSRATRSHPICFPTHSQLPRSTDIRRSRPPY